MKRVLSLLCVFLMIVTLSITLLPSCAENPAELPEDSGAGDSASESESEIPPDSESEEDPEENEYLYLTDGGESEYRIVIDGSATSAVQDLASSLSMQVMNVSGVRIPTVSDRDAPADGGEILLGVSNREDTEALLSEITETGWRIRCEGSRITVVASNDYMLSLACRAFTDTYLEEGERGARIPADLDVSYTADGEMLPLSRGENTRYNVVIPGFASQDMQAAGEKVARGLRSLLKLDADRVKLVNDIASPDPNAVEILLGAVHRPEAEKLQEKLGTMNLRVEIIDGCLVAACDRSEDLNELADRLLEELSALVEGTYDGELMIPGDFSRSFAPIRYLSGVPFEVDGTLVGTRKVDGDGYYMAWRDTDGAAYDRYLTSLSEAGLTETDRTSMGQNLHTTYENDHARVYVSYMARLKEIRASYEPITVPRPTSEQKSYETVEDYVPTLWMLDVDSLGSGANGGMSFVLKVADGSFIIIDGGYDTGRESDSLLKLLKDNTPEGEKPVVSAWYFSHPHGDHVGALLNMTRRHLNEITVKAFYLNFPDTPSLGFNNVEEVYRALEQWEGAVIYPRIRTGMKIYVADALIEVLFTYEDLFLGSHGTPNDNCSVIRVTHGGKQIMFLGDIQDLASDKIEAQQYVQSLGADIVQFSHHGYEGANQALYDMIAAETVLWPVNTYSFQSNNYGQNIFKRMINGGWRTVNRYVAQEATYVKTVICAEEAHGEPYKIELPTYVPRSYRLPDCDALYEWVKEYEGY